ncbi:PREDICTED: uncharacterized protein LOC107172582 [Diuraphis noxia]|uniref:uncharacterized protein LOC107172582 n=1 Tax=Diuraphis noxia TaxID=143948 RepID=UPI0007635554|nr:PREDICTED: uncharacterized protein LOC107172582 [Diuraphis noxia]
MEEFVKTEIKSIMAEGAFGINCNLVSFHVYNDIIEKKDWKYKAIFGVIVTSDEIHYSVFIKLKNCDKMSVDGPLANDVNALSLSRFFYGRNKGGEFAEKDLIVFENVNTLGYRFTEEQIFLDYDHLIIALQAIAK